MRVLLANLAFLIGIVGFLGYLMIVVASAVGCCAGITSATFKEIVLIIFATGVLACVFCGLNNCCKITGKED